MVRRPNKITYPLLRQFSCPLILAVSQQLDNPSLIRCEASNFFHNLANESGPLRQIALGSGYAGLARNGCGFLSEDGMRQQSEISKIDRLHLRAREEQDCVIAFRHD